VKNYKDLLARISIRLMIFELFLIMFNVIISASMTKFLIF